MSQSVDRAVRKFIPGTFQSDDEVIRQFVVRNHELDVVLEVLRGNVDTASCQHVLLVAPRGQGKSMLLARVVAELRTVGEFSERLLPVRFMEESQEIFSLADFWLETLYHLARESAECDPEIARGLQKTYKDLAARRRGEELEERARSTVLEAADRMGKKFVLMVENLQALCGDVDDDFGWKLRTALQSEPQIMLLATATSRFKGLDDATQPFFELFRMVCLEPLATEDCRRLWQVVSGDKVNEREIRPLQILTGGSPRLLVIISEFAWHGSLRRLMEELVRLVDAHTEYFRSHLDAFAKTERRVYLAVIDLWQPSTTSEVAARARMDVRAVSTLLGRLVNRGAVIVEGSGRKRLYAAAERLYSIYYKLRRERDTAAVIRNLIHFMVAFYSGAELAEMSGKPSSEAAKSPVIRKGIEHAMMELPHIGSVFSSGSWSSLEWAHDQSAAIHNARSLVETARAHGKLGETEAAIAAYGEVVARFGDSDNPGLRMQVAKALVNKGIEQERLGKTEAALATCDEVVRRFGDSDDLEHQVSVAAALFNKGITRKKLGETDAAIAAHDEVVRRFGDSNALDLQIPVAKALGNLGIGRERLGKFGAAIEAYSEVVARFGNSDVPDLQGLVAYSLFSKSLCQTDIGETEEALRTCEELEQWSGTVTDDNDIAFEWWACWARAQALLVQGKPVAMMDAFRAVYAAFVSDNEAMMKAMLLRIYDLIAAGASARDLAAVLSSDAEKAQALEPLIVALRQRADEAVRAPAEVLEVAADIRERIEAKAVSQRRKLA